MWSRGSITPSSEASIDVANTGRRTTTPLGAGRTALPAAHAATATGLRIAPCLHVCDTALGSLHTLVDRIHDRTARVGIASLGCVGGIEQVVVTGHAGVDHDRVLNRIRLVLDTRGRLAPRQAPTAGTSVVQL